MRYPEGQFSWVDLMTTDTVRAGEFYTSLFDWRAKEMPTPMGPMYTTFLHDGLAVAGMGEMPESLAANGVPPSWTLYLSVANLESVIERVTVAGGRVLMGPQDVMTQGRMAMIADPSGAAVGLWQPMGHQGAELIESPGAMGWTELQTRDIARAAPFYEQVFGWTWDTSDPGGYLVANLAAKAGDDKNIAGAMAMPAEVPPMVPSYWAVYFMVDDCDAATDQAVALGGRVFFPGMNMGDMRFSGITDPTGAQFMLLSTHH
jgi:predicted enzyme related to lactoylglutathione lyase